MMGLLILGVVAAYVAVFVFVIRKARNTGERITAVVIGLLIPFWDQPIGYVNYRLQCNEHGGFKQVGDIPAQKSIYFEQPGANPERLLKAGLEAVEFKRSSGTVRRYVRSSDGGISIIDASAPISKSRIRLNTVGPTAWNLSQWELTLNEIDSGRAIALARSYAWYGGWIQNVIQRPVPIAECHRDSFSKVSDLAIKGSRK